MKYTKIYTTEQYNRYCDKHEELTLSNEEKNREEIELLEILIDEYELRTLGNVHDDNPVEILRFLLKENAMTNAQLAREIGVSRQLISEILHYKRNISKSMVGKLARRFQVNDSLFSTPYELQPDGRKREMA
ncbi:MAG: helix-turn-helix domain-containing protein [Bacteroidetes bacterium]|jgi:HTH-type transcriptional regulator/antitoxin HigA|nr:helix-turn-helix domain-containing protein [Bacteroidota bacterium]